MPGGGCGTCGMRPPGNGAAGAAAAGAAGVASQSGVGEQEKEEEWDIRVRHYTTKSRMALIVEQQQIIPSDNGRVYVTPGKGKILAPRDFEADYKITQRGKGNHVIEFSAKSSELTTHVRGDTGATELTFPKGYTVQLTNRDPVILR